MTWEGWDLDEMGRIMDERDRMEQEAVQLGLQYPGRAPVWASIKIKAEHLERRRNEIGMILRTPWYPPVVTAAPVSVSVVTDADVPPVCQECHEAAARAGRRYCSDACWYIASTRGQAKAQHHAHARGIERWLQGHKPAARIAGVRELYRGIRVDPGDWADDTTVL